MQPGDERRTAAITWLHFMLAAAIVLVQAPAFGLFVAEFGSQRLPYAYLAIAVLVTALNLVYLRLSNRFPFVPLSYGVLAFLAVACVLLRLGLATPLRLAVIFILPAGFQMVINVTVLVVWPLAGRAFDLREAKRTFGVIAGGSWIASLLTGLVVAPLIAAIGTANLLLCAAAAAMVSLLLLGPVAQACGVWKQGGRTATAVTRRQPTVTHVPLRTLLSGPIIRPLLVYVVLLWVSFYFVDNIMYAGAALRFPDAAELGAFTGRIVAIYGIVAAVMSLFLTGRILARYGVRNALLVLPVLLTIDMAALALAGTLQLSETLVFVLSTAGKVIFAGLAFSLSSTALTFLYQPLPPALRGRTQALAEGVLQSLAIGLGGVLLLLFGSVLKFSAIGLAYVMIPVGLAWIVTIFVIGRQYPQAVSAALAQRRLGEGPGLTVDRDTLDLLRLRLADNSPAIVLYALGTLEREDDTDWPETLEVALPRLLAHPAPEVRAEALHAAARLNGLLAPGGAAPASLSLTPAEVDTANRLASTIAGHLKNEPEPAVRAAGVEAIAALRGPAATPFLVGLLGGNPEVEAAALIALLRLPATPDGAQAEQRLAQLCGSAEAGDRLSAAQVCRAVPREHHIPLLRSLLGDQDVTVRRAALAAAGDLPGFELAEPVIAAGGQIETAAAAEDALAAGGARALPAIAAALAGTPLHPGDVERMQRMTLARACGRIGGESALALLARQADVADGEVRTVVLRALAAGRYRDTSKGFESVDRELRLAGLLAAALVADGVPPSSGPGWQGEALATSLLAELKGARERILLLLAFRFDAGALLGARDALANADEARRAYALEAVEMQLPAGVRPRVMPLVELPPAAELAARLRAAGVDVPTWNKPVALAALVGAAQEMGYDAGADLTGLAPWTHATAIYQAALQFPAVPLALARAGALSPYALVRETAAWAACRGDIEQRNGAPAMLSTVEKVLVLKRAGMFSQMPAGVLTDVARLCDEVDVEAAEQVFAKGDQGDSLYIVVQGRVRVQDGARVLNELGEGDVFGELALLDPEPRMASVTAVEPTCLLRLEQGPFRELIHRYPEVALGVIRVVTRYLRARMADVARLDAQLNG